MQAADSGQSIRRGCYVATTHWINQTCRVMLFASSPGEGLKGMPQPLNPSHGHRERRLTQQRRNRKLAFLIGILLGTLGILDGVVSELPRRLGGYDYSVLFDYITIYLGLVISVAFLVLPGTRRRAQMSARLAQEVLSADQRAPVLYLRPFEVDQANQWYERRIVRSMKQLGPVVTVGRPDEELPATPYIARDYLPEDDWQQHVLDLIGCAQLVIVHVGTSEGLAWELGQLIRQGRPEQIVVCLGHETVPRLPGKLDPTAYHEFFERFNHLFPKGLPVQPYDSTFIAFDPDWRPVLSSELRTRSDGFTLRRQRLHRRPVRFRLF